MGDAGRKARSEASRWIAPVVWLVLTGAAVAASAQQPVEVTPADPSDATPAEITESIQSDPLGQLPEEPPVPGPGTSEAESNPADGSSAAAPAVVVVEPVVIDWMEEQVRSAEQTLRNARFRSALGIARQLQDHPRALAEQRARLAFVVGTAALALGDNAEASASYRRVFDFAPDFETATEVSPKVRRALAAARTGGAGT